MSNFRGKQFKWGYKGYGIATLHGLIVVLLDLWIKSNGFCQNDLYFLQFVGECFTKRQTMSQTRVNVEHKSKCTRGGISKGVKLQVDVLLFEPMIEGVLWTFVVLNISNSTVAVDCAANRYGVLKCQFCGSG